MAFPMNEILPHLFIGNIVNSMDVRHLRENEIAHIVSIYEMPRIRFPDKNYLLIEAHDRANENLMQHFSNANDFIHKARIASQNVLVHCIKGASRSATIIVGYVMSVTKLSWQDALKIVQIQRTIVNPNEGFLKQLEEFQQSGFCEQERERLLKKFPHSELTKVDMQNCIKTLNREFDFLNSCEKSECSSSCSGDSMEVSMMYELNGKNQIDDNKKDTKTERNITNDGDVSDIGDIEGLEKK